MQQRPSVQNGFSHQKCVCECRKKKEASIDPLNCWVGSVHQLESNDSTLKLNTSVILSHPAGVREGFHPLSEKGIVMSGRWYLGTVCGCPVAEEKESERPMKSKPCSFFVSYRWGEIWGKNSLPPRTSSFLFGSLGDPAWRLFSSPHHPGEREEAFALVCAWCLHDAPRGGYHAAALRCTQRLFVSFGDRLDSKQTPFRKTHVGSAGFVEAPHKPLCTQTWTLWLLCTCSNRADATAFTLFFQQPIRSNVSIWLQYCFHWIFSSVLVSTNNWGKYSAFL